MKAKGYTIDIPMPGHPHVESEEDHAKLELLIKEREDYLRLESLIRECDIIFLSTDSEKEDGRQSFWRKCIGNELSMLR